MHSYASVTSKERKKAQWAMLRKVFRKVRIALSAAEVDALVAAESDAAAAALVERLHSTLASPEGYAAAEGARRAYHAAPPEVPASLAPPEEPSREPYQHHRAPQAARRDGYGRQPLLHVAAPVLAAPSGIVHTEHSPFMIDGDAAEEWRDNVDLDDDMSGEGGGFAQQMQAHSPLPVPAPSAPPVAALQSYNDQYAAPRRFAAARKAPPPRPPPREPQSSESPPLQPPPQRQQHAAVAPPVVTMYASEGYAAQGAAAVVRVAADPAAAFVFGGGAAATRPTPQQLSPPRQAAPHAVQRLTARMEHAAALAHADNATSHGDSPPALPSPRFEARAARPKPASSRASSVASDRVAEATAPAHVAPRASSRASSVASVGYSARSRAVSAQGRARAVGTTARSAAAATTSGVAPQCASGVPGHLRGADFVPYTQVRHGVKL